jgi:hypothetical protein
VHALARINRGQANMQNDTKKKQPYERKPAREGGGQASETPPRRRRGPYGPIRSGRYAHRTPRNEG